MYLPMKYAPLMLDTRGYTLQQAWVMLHQAFEQDNFLQTADHILTWLRVALHATQANNRGAPANVMTLSPINYGCRPYQPLAPTPPQCTALSLSVDPWPRVHNHANGHRKANQIAEARTACLAREVERNQPTSPSTKIGLLFPCILNFLLKWRGRETSRNFGSTSLMLQKSENSRSSRNIWTPSPADLKPFFPKPPF
jgi:hypothetical protein